MHCPRCGKQECVGAISPFLKTPARRPTIPRIWLQAADTALASLHKRVPPQCRSWTCRGSAPGALETKGNTLGNYVRATKGATVTVESVSSDEIVTDRPFDGQRRYIRDVAARAARHNGVQEEVFGLPIQHAQNRRVAEDCFVKFVTQMHSPGSDAMGVTGQDVGTSNFVHNNGRTGINLNAGEPITQEMIDTYDFDDQYVKVFPKPSVILLALGNVPAVSLVLPEIRRNLYNIGADLTVITKISQLTPSRRCDLVVFICKENSRKQCQVVELLKDLPGHVHFNANFELNPGERCIFATNELLGRRTASLVIPYEYPVAILTCFRMLAIEYLFGYMHLETPPLLEPWYSVMASPDLRKVTQGRYQDLVTLMGYSVGDDEAFQLYPVPKPFITRHAMRLCGPKFLSRSEFERTKVCTKWALFRKRPEETDDVTWEELKVECWNREVTLDGMVRVNWET